MFPQTTIEILISVARLGSFTAAAELHHKVPSAVSYIVRQVEQELDVVLFRRLHRKVELTSAGVVFIKESEILLRQMNSIKAQTRRAAVGWQSNLKLTLDNVVKIEQLKPIIEAFYDRFEHSELQVNMEVFNGSWDAISTERADIVIGATSAIPVNGDYLVKNMGTLEWVFVMSSTHPLTKLPELTEEAISVYPYICLDDTSVRLPKRHLGSYRTQRRLLLPNWYSAIEMLISGAGVGYLPGHIAKKYLTTGELVHRAIPNPQEPSQCCLVWKKDNGNKLIDWMVDYLGDTEQLNRQWLANN